MINEMMIRCFLSLCRTGNFTRTAEELFLSQQAVSRNIAKLETELGTPLFVRKPGTTETTEHGTQYRELFSRFAEEFGVLVQETRGSGTAPCALQVGYQALLDFGRAPYRAFHALQQAMPQASVTVDRFSPKMCYSKLESGELSAAIMYERFLPSNCGFHVHKLMDSRHVMIVAADYPGLKEGASYHNLCFEPLVFDSLEESGTTKEKRHAKTFAANAGLSPKKIVFMKNREAAYTAVEQGVGVLVSTEINRIMNSEAFATLPMDTFEGIVAVWGDNVDQTLVRQYVDLLSATLHDA